MSLKKASDALFVKSLFFKKIFVNSSNYVPKISNFDK